MRLRLLPPGPFAPFTVDEVKALLAAQKYVRHLPKVSSSVSFHVFLKSGATPRDLVITAFGQPKFGCAFKVDGTRIAGVNWAPVHPGINGEKVRGWHEHVYQPGIGARDVVPIAVADEHPDQLLRFCLSKWNIHPEGGIPIPQTLFGGEKSNDSQ